MQLYGSMKQLKLIIVLLFCIQLFSSKKIYLYTRLLPLNSNPNETTHVLDTSHYEITNALRIPVPYRSNLTLIKLEACNNDGGDNKYSVKQKITCNNREARSIIGDDDRIEVDRQRYPYSTIVNIHSRCNGVAVGYNYVLTSAQCVYYHYYTRPTIKVTRINGGELSQIEAEIDKVFFPIEWIDLIGNKLERFKYNYALIKLTQGQQTYVPIHMNTPTPIESQCNSQFTQAGFDYNNQDGNITILRSRCESKFETFETTFIDCDSNVNEKGNPLFTLYKRKNGYYYNSVGGILVGNFGKYYLDHRIEGKEYNLGLRINYEVFLRLCTWMDRLDKCRQYYPKYFPLDSLTEI